MDTLAIRSLRPDAPLPARTRPGDAALDLAAADPFTLAAGETLTIGTGCAIAVPDGMAGLVLPRSGLAARHSLTILNAPGLIDPGYRGEVKVVLHNAGREPYEGRAGDRIAQLVLVACATPVPEVVDELPPAPDDRGEAGFGSSGR